MNGEFLRAYSSAATAAEVSRKEKELLAERENARALRRLDDSMDLPPDTSGTSDDEEEAVQEREEENREQEECKRVAIVEKSDEEGEDAEVDAEACSKHGDHEKCVEANLSETGQIRLQRALVKH